MKSHLRKIFSGILIALYISSMAFSGAVFATPQSSMGQLPAGKHEPKRGINPETGKVSFIGAGDPLTVAGVTDLTGVTPQERAIEMASVYGREFGLKHPKKELLPVKSGKDSKGNDVVHYQQMYEGIPIIGGKIIVNMNAKGELLSISGEVSSDLVLDTKPAIRAQEALKTALQKIAELYKIDGKELTASDPELSIFDESILTASTRPVELVWHIEVTAKDGTQPIRELVLVNAQTGEVSFHINQVDDHHAPAPLATAGPGWYVSMAGSDSNLCTSPASPCATVPGAFSKAQNNGTIFVAKGTYTGTTSPILTITNKNNITISGGWDESFNVQDGLSTLDGQGARQILKIIPGTATPPIRATLDRLQITNGIGPAVTVSTGAILTIHRSAIRGNITNSYSGGGFFVDGRLDLNNSIVSNNTARSGAGIYVNTNGGVFVNNSTITENAASSSSIYEGDGGAFYRTGSGVIEIRNSIVAKNTATRYGANCYSSSADAFASFGHNIFGPLGANCYMTPDATDQVDVDPRLGPWLAAGYFALAAGSPAIDAGDPATCLAEDGRGVTRPVGSACDIGAYEYKTPGPVAKLVIQEGSNQRAAIEAEYASALKALVLDSVGSPVGGITVTFRAPASGATGTFSNTQIYLTSAVTDTNGIATASIFTANTTTGMYVVNATVSGIATPAQFTLTNAAWFVSPDGSDSNTCFTQASPCKTIQAAVNKAVAGDSIFVAEGTYNGSSNYVVNLSNSNYRLSGGWNATFTERTGRSVIDGRNSLRGIQILGESTQPGTVIEHFIIENCFGGGIYIQASGMTLTDVIIRNNTVEFYGGAGLYVSYGTVVVNDSLFVNNRNTAVSTSYNGAAISHRGSLTLNNTTLVNNVSTNSGGGGIYTQSGYTLALNNSTISGNSAAGNGGGLLLDSGATVNINNSTIAYNTAQNGGGLYIKSGTGTYNLRNSIVSNNSATVTAADCYALASNPFDSLNYSLIGNITSCNAATETGNLKNVNPLLTSTLIGWPGFHLIPGNSPVIAKGDPAAPGTCLSQDQRGVPREAPCDMGAVEYISTGAPAILTTISGSGQEAVPLTAFNLPLVARLTDQYYNPVGNKTVKFTAPPSGASGTFANSASRETSVTTGSDGLATAPVFTANGTSGPYTVYASHTGISSTAGFLLKNIFPAVSVSSGSPQATQVLTAFSDPLKVLVQYAPGAPVAGMEVTFTAPSAGATGTFSGSSTARALTNANGIATAPAFTANSTVGSFTVTASIPDIAVTADFQLTNIASISCSISSGADSPSLFHPYKQFNCGKNAYGVGSGDFNGDDRKDVAVSVRTGTGAQSVLLIFTQANDGNLTQPRVYAGGNRAESLAVGDVNHDGLEDVVTGDFYDNKISVFIQKSDGGFASRLAYTASTGPDAVAVGDVNNDGRNDVVVAHWNSALIGVFTQKADGTLNPMTTYPSVSAGYDDIAIGDVNGDGLNDVVKMNGQGLNPNIMVYLQNSNNTLNTSVNYSIGACSSTCLSGGIGIGDVTGDGLADVILSYGGNKPSSNIAVFAQNANGTLDPSVSYPAYDIPEPVAIADMNLDTLPDVVTVHSGWLRAGLFLQRSDGILSSELLYTLPNYYPEDLDIGDVNGDGLPDMLIADNTGLIVLYRNANPPSTPTPGPGPSPTPRPSATPGPSPTPVPPSSTGNRRTYTAAGGGSLPGYFLCDQTQSSCTNGADLDADAAHRYAADTFVFYNTHHGRNSFDNAGGTIVSTVNYGVSYRNAFWNGSQVVYGDTMAADDVVAHEITHGVTEYTSNLIYYGQSGAINESFSDVWGELIDQTNGSGNDSLSLKWLMGEDSALGVIRSMSNPPAYGDPDRMGSPYYYTGSDDNGGVHINSGVNNKAAYLMVEGGIFNGRTILGIGIAKTAAVYYEAQVNHLTMGANYNDLYYALLQACQNLIGVDGMTENDCEQVRLAAEAVEMFLNVTIPTDVPTYYPDTSTPTATPFTPATPTKTKTPTPTFTFTPTKTGTPTGTATATATATSHIPNVGVWIAGSQVGSHLLDEGQAMRVSYTSINNGPVKLMSTTMQSLVGAESIIYKVNGLNTSFSEMMGLPAGQIDTTYWLPWYNNVDLDTQLRFANVSNTTATVRVYVGGLEMNGSPFTLLAGQSTRKSFPGINAGPVRIVSNASIVAAERIIYRVNGVNTSFSEMMALPGGQVDTTYFLPWYNNVDLDTQLRFANVSNTTATVRVYIGGLEMTGSPFTLQAGESTRKSFAGVNSGPVEIVSTQPIVAAERVIYKAAGGVNTSFSEMMALPNSQQDTTFWLPWYNNKDLDTQLRFANTTNTPATVHVFIGGTEMTGSPFALQPNESTRRSFLDINGGPVKIVSNVPIVAAERVIYKVNGINASFSEMMGLPANQLDTTYWLPWYNNVDLITQLRFGVP